MKVILQQDLKGMGKKDDLISVSDGYARNYLFPRNLAKEATDGILKEIKNKKQAATFRVEKEHEKAVAMAGDLNGKSIVIKARGGGGKLFGSVTAAMIAQAIETDCGLEIDKRKIVIEEEIKSFGTFEVVLKIHTGVSAKIFVQVVG